MDGVFREAPIVAQVVFIIPKKIASYRGAPRRWWMYGTGSRKEESLKLPNGTSLN
jgi:hypothetical protein